MFWVFVCLQLFYEDINLEAKNTFKFASYNFFIYIIPVIAFVTVFTQILMPKFLQRKKYLEFFIWAIVISIANIIIVYFLAAFYMDHIFPVESGGPLDPHFRPHAIAIITVSRCTRTLVLALAVFAINFFKIIHSQQIENIRISKERNEHDLQVAKNKIQSVFLLDALQSIYREIDNADFDAPRFILILSEVLSYILYDAEASKVSILKELEAAELLIKLENLSIKRNNKMVLKIEENAGNKFIQPLLLFNCICEILRSSVVRESGNLSFLITLRKEEQVSLLVSQKAIKPSRYDFSLMQELDLKEM